jgi:V8-like Glu-specific endopeptidase
VVVPIVGALACLAVTIPAEAQPPAAEPAAVSTSISTSKVGSASNYWTKERMRSAKPMLVPRLNALAGAGLTQRTKPQGPAGQVDGAAVATKLGPRSGAGLSALAGTWAGPATSAPATTSGKIFFVGADGGNYVCSGSTVNSAGKTVVFTAGHCLSDGAGRWYNSKPWIFAPGYKNDVAPYGYWTARQLWTRPAFHNGGNRAEDIGAALMFPLNGTRIVNRVGGQGIEWNHPLSQFQYQFGYPQRTPFNGQLLKYCTGNSYNDAGHNGLNCNMTEGASGGPWLDEFNGSLGWLDSVNSWVFWNAAGTRYKWNGPYFGNNARDFYQTVTAAEL